MNLKTQISALCFLSLVLLSVQSIAQYVVSSYEIEQQGLAAALRAVIEHNPSLRAKAAELEAQGYAVDTSRAARYPSFSVGANNLNEAYGNQGTATISQPIYAFGKIDANITSALAEYSLQQWDMLRIQRQLLEDAAVAYVSVSGAERRLEVAAVNIEQHDLLFQRIERREQGQLASEADVLLANSRLIQAEAQKQRILGDFQVALAELRAITIVEVSTHIAVEDDLLNLQSEQFLQEAALRNSAEIGYQRQLYKAAEIKVKSEELASLPSVYLQAEYDFLDKRINADTSRFGLTIEADLDGFGFATRSRIRGAHSYLDAAEQQINVSVQDVRRQVSVLVANRDTQASLIRSQNAAIEAVELTLESFIRQYETGRKSWVEVLNTQRDLTNLRFDLVNYETELMVFSFRLQGLVGELDAMAGAGSP